MSTESPSLELRSPLERFLGLFANIQANEGKSGLLLLINISLILIAYYLIKPVREGWLAVSVISGLSKLEVKAYSAFGQSLLLLGILPVYAFFARRWSRSVLITRTAIFSACMLVVFWSMQPGLFVEQVPYAGVLFYMFVGIFIVTLVAQFWSFASDLYGEERGKRLFPLIAVGASAGAMIGSYLGERLIRFDGLEAFDLILCAIVPLALGTLLARKIDRAQAVVSPAYHKASELAANEKEGPFSSIIKYRYLTAMAAIVMMFNWIIASGDNILYGLVQQLLEKQIEIDPTLSPELFAKAIKEATTHFYSELYFWVNLCGLLVQAFLVSRIVQLGGFGLLILATPIISLVAYISITVAPVLGLVKIMKVAENSSNYSINNTARHMMWLPTSKAILYQVKPTVDTFFVRLGDGLAALTVLVGTRIFNFELKYFIYFNILLVLIWILLAVYLYREHKKWSQESSPLS